ncbi:tetratricopeptide repeat protein [Bacteroides helcogenes]|uniref:Tetratricopeptide TPR_1 repeat-containing protein n=1 Tax=Bacteroides helcogenes (strain ATCC 35417 / DSM 20613 / JCM 6297 / CCUG 15421 / P 36-108) TaxID=693979 RepID=E6STE5_BACT6|nr:tetratricopeptide repeat protein [Bacteroides helcogenes]ADV43219.1 Tetratricopeptide TPR_1 repeat-containing protein [Bacteroides helcogenes P 36-108]MDY5239194.1 tetratricopeptide repeat protein [Bacteroides helcogenes]
MKDVIRISLFLLATTVFCACGHKPYPQSLIVADSLTNAHPDSAVSLLKSLESTIQAEPEATQMYYRLLCIKAGDKAYKLHTSDSLILPVLHYYIEKDDERHLAEAYYYAGRVYRDLGDAPQALDYFEKALEALPEDKGGKLKGRIYSQMGTLFSYQGLYAEALKMYKMNRHYDLIIQDSVGLIFTLRDIGNMYRELGKQDSTLVYLKKANLLSQQLPRTGLFNLIQSQLAALYTDLQEYDSARTVLQNALRDTEQSNKSSIYSIAARFYDTTGNTDSAVWYYNKLLDFGSVYAKRTAYRRLLELAIERNNTKQASDYLHGYLCNIDSIQKLTQTETIYRMHALYNYQLREKENMQLKAENRNKTFWTVVTSGGFIIIIVSFIAFRQYYKRRNLELKQQLEKLQNIEKENQEKIEFLEGYKSQKEELKKNLTNISIPEGNAREQKIELLNHILQQQVIEAEQEKRAQEHLLCSDLYKKLQERANSVRGEAYITSEEWNSVREFISPAYPTFLERLYSLHTPNENELHVCILLKLQFRPADIARLLQLKPESISSIRKRLYQKVTGSKGNPELWDKIIHSL